MKSRYLLGLLFLITIFIQGVYASPFMINYSYVNTDSQPEYLNIQYGHFYDNVNLKLRLQATNGYSNIPVVVSPKVYGIDGGQLTYLYSIPTQTYNVYSTPQDYLYSNVFYLSPNYDGYVVKVYAESSGIYYNTYSQAYIYPVNTAPYFYPVDDGTTADDSDDEITIDCSDFFLSGQTDVYIDEDEEKTYNLYIENEASQDLEILDIETSDPSRLDIDDIDYPDEVPDSSVRTVRVYLEADSVSDDYDSSFDITVSAKYNDSIVCTKTYGVEYHIDDQDDDEDSDASCSDIVIKNTSFTINDDYVTTKTITVENNSEDYDFDIDDITIEDRDGIDATITDEPSKINSDDTEGIEIELETDNFDTTTTKYLELKITGTFDDDEDKECTKRANLAVTIENDGSNYNYNNTASNCKSIAIYSSNISQEEETTNSYSREDGFFIVNNSDNTFTVTNVSVSDNTSYGNITNIDYSNTLGYRSVSSIDFDFITNKVSSQQSSRGAISVSGRFSDGKTCNYSDIGTKYFDISVFEPTTTSCAGIEVQSKDVSSGNNQVNIYNHTSKKFYVKDILFQNRYGLSGNVTNKQLTVLANNSSPMTVGISGSGSLEMLVSGRFEDGKNCSFTQTDSGFLSTGTNANLSPTDCDIQIVAPTAITVNNSLETVDLTVKNNTSKGGKIEITGNGLATDPSVIYLSGFDNFTQTINLSNFNNPTGIYYTATINNCSTTRTFTNVINTVLETERISLVSYPTLVSPTSNTIMMMVSVNNSFTTNKEITLKLTGLPNGFVSYPKTLTLSSHETKNASLELSIPDNASKIEYRGYIELYSGNSFINKYPITIDLSPALMPITITAVSEKAPTQDRTYLLTLTLKNNTNVLQETIIDFGLSETYAIDGDKEINLLPGEEQVKKYKVVSPTALKEDKVVNILLKDKTTSQELASKKITLESTTSPLSGFLTLGNAGLVILGLIIVIALVLVFRKR